MQCPICTTHEIADQRERAMNACFECAKRVGLIPMPPATRPPKPCSTCGGRKFLRAIPREHTVSKISTAQTSAQMMLTHPIDVAEGILRSSAEDLEISRGFGALEVYACYGCGKVEWFCTDVAKVPIDPHLMTEVVDYDGAGPYR